MQQMAQQARQPLPVRSGALPARVPLQHRRLPRPRPLPRVVGVLRWLFRRVFVQPVGRRAREERLRALPDRILRDIGLKRADGQAAAFGMVRLSEVMRYPSAGPLYVCGRPGFRPTLVRLSEAA